MLRFLTVFRDNQKAIRAYKTLLHTEDDPLLEWTPTQQRAFIKHHRLRYYFQDLLKEGFPLHSMQGWDFKRFELPDMDFSDCDLRDADFRSSLLCNATFDSAQVDRADFRKANLKGATFIGSHCYKTNFRLACLQDTDFTSANTRQVKKDPTARLYKKRLKETKQKGRKMVVISPDKLLFDDGIYVWTKERVARAWAQSYKDFGNWVIQTTNKAKTDPDPAPVLVMLCGIPGAGKTYWLKDAVQGHPSTWANGFGDDSERTLVLDAIFTTRIARSALLNVASVIPGIKKIAVSFDTPLSICLSRNAQRSPDRRVPTNTIYEMNKRVETPTLLEGFDEVKVIRHVQKEAEAE